MASVSPLPLPDNYLADTVWLASRCPALFSLLISSKPHAPTHSLHGSQTHFLYFSLCKVVFCLVLTRSFTSSHRGSHYFTISYRSSVLLMVVRSFIVNVDCVDSFISWWASRSICVTAMVTSSASGQGRAISLCVADLDSVRHSPGQWNS